ncbi:MAG: HupE/UreJ family protein [Pseudomonadota bacterium]
MKCLHLLHHLILGIMVCTTAAAHELKTATLRLDESAAGRVQATLMVPMAGEESPRTVVPQFDPRCQIQGDLVATREPDKIVRSWRLHCTGGLANTQIRFLGLDPRMPEALVIANFATGKTQTLAMDRHDPMASLGNGLADSSHDLGDYFPIGVEHILLGPDHLLFVFGLMLVVAVGSGSARQLLAAITAFTAAHSLTLGLALFGIWGLPTKPVEMLIAASILLLALELAWQQRAATPATSLTFRQPWLIAFGFGLLHGFGFAGALSAVGLPDAARGWALLYFNLGVEAGQLLFVLLVWQVMKYARIGWPLNNTRSRVAVYALGGLATYWLLDRTALWLHSSHLLPLPGGLT